MYTNLNTATTEGAIAIDESQMKCIIRLALIEKARTYQKSIIRIESLLEEQNEDDMESKFQDHLTYRKKSLAETKTAFLMFAGYDMGEIE